MVVKVEDLMNWAQDHLTTEDYQKLLEFLARSGGYILIE